MNGRRAIVGLCMLCALLVSAVAVQSASAISGTTAFTCVKTTKAANQFTDAHCKSAGEGEFKHVSFAEKTTTEVTGNDSEKEEEEVKKGKATIGGVPITLTATGLTISGSMENLVDENKEHYAHGTGTGVFTGVVVSVPKCFVYTDDGTGTPSTKGVVDTEKLTGTTTAQEHGVKFTPVVGEVLATLWIKDSAPLVAPEECSIANTYQYTGSIKGTPEGATIAFSHAGTTAQGTFKFGPVGSPVKAGLEGKVTLAGRAKGGGTYNPLSPTTVAT